MATNIPLPGLMGDSFLKGMDSGSSMFQRMMQPILEREKQKQQDAQFRANEARMGSEFDRQFAQTGGMNNLRRMLIEEQIKHQQNLNDPNYAAKQFQSQMDMFTGGQGGMQQPSPAPEQEAGQGMGMFSPEGLKQAQQQARQPQQQAGSMNMDALRNNPMLRGFFHKTMGFDPLEAVPQTEEQKLDFLRKQQDIRNESKGGDVPTPAVLTQNQLALLGIDTVLPMLDDLIKSPSKIYGRFDFNPSKKAAYNAKTSAMIDTLVAAQSLPKVQASIDLVAQQIRRDSNEEDGSYIDRLKDLKKELLKRRVSAANVIDYRKISTANPTVQGGNDLSSMTEQQLHDLIAGGE